nr:helix-turn-helix transcriptional regulator [Kaistia adipata]
MTKSVSAGQIRAARALVRMDQATLAKSAGVSVPTIKRIEASDGEPATSFATVMRIIEALESAGIEFIPENGGGAGVRWRDRATAVDEGKSPEELTSENDG